MSSEYAKLGHPTGKMNRVDPEDRDERQEAITKVECPVCKGSGCVPAEVAVAVDIALAMRKDEE